MASPSLTPRTQQLFNTASLALEKYRSVTDETDFPSDESSLALRVARLVRLSDFPLVAPEGLPGSSFVVFTENTQDPINGFIARHVELIVGHDEEVGVIFRGQNPVVGGADKNVFPGVFFSRSIRPLHVAIAKTFPRKTSTKKVDYNQREFVFWSQSLKSPYPGVVRVLALRKDADSIAPADLSTQFTAVYPYCPADLFGIMIDGSIRNHLSAQAIFELQSTSVIALLKFHEAGMIHRDIKPENLLVEINPPENLSHLNKTDPLVLQSSQTRFRVLICDPSYAKRIEEKIEGEGAPGTIQYISPETACYIEQERLRKQNGGSSFLPFEGSQKCDVFSLGLVLLGLQDLDLFYKVVPFIRYEELLSLGYRETDAVSVFYSQYAEYYREGMIRGFEQPKDINSTEHIIWCMLQPNPEIRPSIREVSDEFKRIALEKFNLRFEES